LKGIYLGLGSNLGDRRANLDRALKELAAAGIRIKKISSYIETDPVGGPPQGKFLNAAAQVETSLSPIELLEAVKSIEKCMGREKTVRNGPRLIDIDVLLYDEVKMNGEELTIPHPRMLGRAFVMAPLREIAPQVKEVFHEDH
jgi:2-amino-4-hydroxy-6-hydroxymethyldihydropteridine diphosphokinase